MTGIEPVASSLPRKRSTPELHRRFFRFKVLGLKFQIKILAKRTQNLQFLISLIYFNNLKRDTFNLQLI